MTYSGVSSVTNGKAQFVKTSIPPIAQILAILTCHSKNGIVEIPNTKNAPTTTMAKIASTMNTIFKEYPCLFLKSGIINARPARIAILTIYSILRVAKPTTRSTSVESPSMVVIVTLTVCSASVFWKRSQS